MAEQADDDLVRVAADLFGAERSEVFISLDERTVPGSRVRREVRALLEARLLLAESAGAPSVDVPLSDVGERVLEWGSIVLLEDMAARLVDEVAAEGWVLVERADPREVRVRRGPGPARDAREPEDGP